MYSSWTKLPGSDYRELKHSPLTGKELELVGEAQQYRLDIVGISSTKRRSSETVQLNGGWKILCSGVDAAMSAQARVGLLVSPYSLDS